MGKYNAVPYNQHMGNPNAVRSHAHDGVPAGAVPYISWPAGEADEDTVEPDKEEV